MNARIDRRQAGSVPSPRPWTNGRPIQHSLETEDRQMTVQKPSKSLTHVAPAVTGSSEPSIDKQQVGISSEPTPLPKVEWKSTSTHPFQLPPPGQTGSTLLAGKLFERKSHNALAAELEALLAAWPKNTPQGVTPPVFAERAEAMDAYKAKLSAELLDSKNADFALQVVGDLNIMHGKSGHTNNVAQFVYALVSAPEVSARLGPGTPEQRARMGALLADAAQWLNLCDAQVPTAILSAPRRLTEEEIDKYVKPRAEQSARMLERLGFAQPEVVEFVRQHRGGGQRALAAQLLDLCDQAAAMAAKPLFLDADGKLDSKKLAAALRGNAERAGLDPELVQAVTSHIEAGSSDRLATKRRSQDLWAG